MFFIIFHITMTNLIVWKIGCKENDIYVHVKDLITVQLSL